jgi:hypothetical protein
VSHARGQLANGGLLFRLKQAPIPFDPFPLVPLFQRMGHL